MSLDDAIPLNELKEGYLYELEQTRSGGAVGIFRGTWFETYDDDGFMGSLTLMGTRDWRQGGTCWPLREIELAPDSVDRERLRYLLSKARELGKLE